MCLSLLLLQRVVVCSEQELVQLQKRNPCKNLGIKKKKKKRNSTPYRMRIHHTLFFFLLVLFLYYNLLRHIFFLFILFIIIITFYGSSVTQSKEVTVTFIVLSTAIIQCFYALMHLIDMHNQKWMYQKSKLSFGKKFCFFFLMFVFVT